MVEKEPDLDDTSQMLGSSLWYLLAFDTEIFRFASSRISFPDLIVEALVVILIEGFVSHDPTLELLIVKSR